MTEAARNFAYSDEGRESATNPSFGYSVSLERHSYNFEILDESSTSGFDARQKLVEAIHGVFTQRTESDSLLYAAAEAQQRLKARREESVEDWAKRLAPSFFRDIEK